ncbi:cupin domain-containing protein [Nautilia lithotrophica]
MKNEKSNLFEIENLPSIDSETFEILLKHKNVEIKKIISNTLKTPQTFCQKEDEFVVLLKGCAKIEINGEIKKLKAGDWLFIPANTPHTLIKTKKTAIWLAIHIY